MQLWGKFKRGRPAKAPFAESFSVINVENVLHSRSFAFADLGSDLYDMSAIWNEASQAFAKQTAEYAAKANTEFRFASSVTPIETSSAPEFLHTTVKSSDRKRILKLVA